MRFVRGLIVPALLIAAGWYGGARWGAPEFVFSTVNNVVSSVIGMAKSAAGNDAPDQDAATSDNSSAADAPKPKMTSATTSSPPVSNTQPSASQSEDLLVLCKTKVSNAPRADTEGRVAEFSPTVDLNGVQLLVKPATKACLSSGYGHRGYSPHRGIDYFSDMGGDVLASADGVVREATYRDDYGNMIIIDHGSGVITRYAHLASFASAVREGAGVKRGQRLGPIGQTGRTSATHLHFEIRTGDYIDQSGAFDLNPVDPFSL